MMLAALSLSSVSSDSKFAPLVGFCASLRWCTGASQVDLRKKGCEMGYYYVQRSAQSFFVPAVRVSEFDSVVKQYYGDDQYPYWKFKKDASGNVIEADMGSEHKSYDEELFELVAPFIQDGSFLEIEGEEEGDLFRLVFNNGQIEKKFPKIVWK